MFQGRFILTFQSVGLTAAQATLITTSFSDGSGFGPGPTFRGLVLAAVIHAASFFSIAAIFQFERRLK
jgi:hypothetical protein